MLVYAFDQGGTTTAAIVAVVQLVPSAVFAPIGGALADRYPAARVLVGGYLAQALALGATAVAILAGGAPPLAYALSAIAAAAVTITRPTQAVLLPEISRRPDELTAANVVIGCIETGMALAGPAVAGAILAVSSPGIVFLVFAVVMAAATEPIVEISLLRTTRIFGALAVPKLGGVARGLVPVDAPAGAVIIRQGDQGDCYYVVADGEVEAEVDGHPVASLGRSEGFGEVALLHDRPRNATVTAVVDTRFYALDRESFLIEVTGHAAAGTEARAVVLERLNEPA